MSDSVRRIFGEAFTCCNSLTSIDLPTHIPFIDETAFFDCDKLTAINIKDGGSHYSSEDGVLYYASKRALIAYPKGKPNPSYTLPGSVTAIMDGAFRDCDKLASIDVEDGNEDFSSENGVLYNRDKTVLFTYPKGKKGTAFTVPNSVTSIARYAFYDRDSLSSVTLPEGITSIGNKSFYSCTGLTSVTVPESVASILTDAFGFCTALSKVEVKGKTPPRDVGNGIFSGIDANAVLTVPAGATAAYASWREYFNGGIVESQTSHTENVNVPVALRISSTAGMLQIDGLHPEEIINVYSTSGRQVYSGRATDTGHQIPALSNGLYIVTAGNRQQKVLVNN